MKNLENLRHTQVEIQQKLGVMKSKSSPLRLGFEYGMEWSLKLEGVGGYGILEDWNGMRIQRV